MASRAAGGAASDLVRQARVTGVMAIVFAAGFSVQFAMGRSSFAAPPIVHAHALVFFGWVALSLLQAGLAASGNIALHRRLGWLSVAWIAAMLPLGVAVTLRMVANGKAPFFFQPQHFLFDDPATLLAFAVLAGWAIVRRRDTGWHRRLQLCALGAVMGPAFGRLLPMPFIIPYAFIAAAVPGLLFPAWLAWREWRQDGVLHPAWLPGLALLPMLMLAAYLLAESPLGNAAYAVVTAGRPGAAVPGLAYPPLPPL